MLGVGLHFARRAGRSVADYFVSGGNSHGGSSVLSAVAYLFGCRAGAGSNHADFQGGLLGNGICGFLM